MKFKVGDVVENRHGDTVRIVCTDRQTTGPLVVVGLLREGGMDYEVTKYYTADGALFVQSPSLGDLIPPKKKVWLNVYRGHTSPQYDSKEEADRNANDLSRIACIKVEYHEGQGID